ncbi:uncharacterized protein LOC8271943 isoform X1 [Ricinus communis]|uniref:uncharacterized protein LOC8271943 isoform X1 n=1 Tax=Ricinus communis TaxID=3988 RepID=UPI000772215F|nr:uncharacterized protein LOC8271943 isoform X1 [Ricinus communis]|eukprot:XP_002523831.2 uncharacterized protein LOC8271943 isoform X2 [Ricinus communis]
MDINGPSRFRHRKTPSTDRFLAAYPRTSEQASSAAVNTADIEENELNEDDIFSTGDFSEASNNHRHHHQTNSPPSSTSSPRSKPAFGHLDSFGILAALPEHKNKPHGYLYQKTAISAASTSSSRFIPKPPQERLPINSGSHQQPQSAPVNVPAMAMRMRPKDFDEIDEDDDEGDGEMLPPHEIVARAQSPMLACSVLEGVGRTLKGRDLRQCLYYSSRTMSTL